MNIDPQGVIEALKVQRNQYADDAALLKAALDGAQADLRQAQTRIAELEAANNNRPAEEQHG